MTRSFNPYEPPRARLAEPFLCEGELATRWSRLGAAILDGLIQLALFVPVLFYLGVYDGFPNIQPLSITMQLGLATVGFLCWVAVNGYFLHAYAQTIGKRVAGIVIARPNGERAGFGRIVWLRALPIHVITQVPIFGALLYLINVLFIFGESRRCLHDRIAGTIVVKG